MAKWRMKSVIYDLAKYRILRYPLALIFLIDFHLFWRFTEKELQGDVATNVSSGLAMYSGLIGKIWRIKDTLLRRE